MSASFESALGGVNYGKYIDAIQDELRRIISDIGPGKSPQEVEAAQARIQELFRRLSKDLAKEAGLQGNHVMLFMMSTAILAAAWVTFTLRREASDLSKSPEDRLTTIELLDSLDLGFAKVISMASTYADSYPGAKHEGAPESAASETA